MDKKKSILIWDNDGTIMGSTSPNDPTRIILPGVKEKMETAGFNFIISGIATPESEAQNFDPEKVTQRFADLMEKLPVKAAVFSPAIGGVACYVVLKKPEGVVVKEAHKDPRYQSYIGSFKKPGIGMFVVLRDLAQEEFGQVIDKTTSCMIGDTWHDETAATDFGIPFFHARTVHERV